MEGNIFWTTVISNQKIYKVVLKTFTGILSVSSWTGNNSVLKECIYKTNIMSVANNSGLETPVDEASMPVTLNQNWCKSSNLPSAKQSEL